MALIYIVEDDDSIREVEIIALKNSNYDVISFSNAKNFYEKLEEKLPDLILLDIMLPYEDGFSIVKKLRENHKTKLIPIIMVTAKTTELEMVKALDNGADDYIKKPFSVLELLSRVKALLRRVNVKSSILNIGLISLDNERHEVKVCDSKIVLTKKEYDLLYYLMINENIVLTRENIMNLVWGYDLELESRTVDMHIKTLRQKLNEASKQIITIRGVGYTLKDTEKCKENEKKN